MTLPANWPAHEILLGAPNYGVRKGTTFIVFHTTEGTDASHEAALATVKWQGTTGNTSGGSYHWVLYDEPGGAILSVPYRDIAGSLNPSPTRRWPRDKYPWLPGAVGEAAWIDPNAYGVAISLSGKTANFVANGYPPNMVDTAARLVIWVEEQSWGPDDIVLTSHFNWNTSRSDPGAPFVDLVLARYKQIKGGVTVPEVPVATAPPNVRVKPEKWNAGAVTTIAETMDGVYRLRTDGVWIPRSGMTPVVPGGDPLFIEAFNAVMQAGRLVADAKAVEAALAPYKTRMSEFRALVEKPVA